MAGKADFTPDEWKAVVASPMLAGMAVTLAEPSGLWGMMKESFASGQALLEAKNNADASELAKAIVADLETAEGRDVAREGLRSQVAGKSPPDAKQQILAALAAVGKIVDAKSPGAAPAFKAWLISLSTKVAEASSEGGFLGFGGVQVSEAEKASLADIAKALGGA